MDSIRDTIAAERAELTEVLAQLPAHRRDEPTLCAGWRVRASDIGWTLGSGTPVTGTAQDLALFLSGRELPPGVIT